MKKKKECKWFFCCPMRRYHEKGLIEPEWIYRYCKGENKTCIRYQMEESGQYHPDYMMPDGSIRESLRNK